MLPKIDKDADGFITEEELKDFINFMHNRYIQNDVERTWNNYDKEKVINGTLISKKITI